MLEIALTLNLPGVDSAPKASKIIDKQSENIGTELISEICQERLKNWSLIVELWFILYYAGLVGK